MGTCSCVSMFFNSLLCSREPVSLLLFFFSWFSSKTITTNGGQYKACWATFTKMYNKKTLTKNLYLDQRGLLSLLACTQFGPQLFHPLGLCLLPRLALLRGGAHSAHCLSMHTSVERNFCNVRADLVCGVPISTCWTELALAFP